MTAQCLSSFNVLSRPVRGEIYPSKIEVPSSQATLPPIHEDGGMVIHQLLSGVFPQLPS